MPNNKIEDGSRGLSDRIEKIKALKSKESIDTNNAGFQLFVKMQAGNTITLDGIRPETSIEAIKKAIQSKERLPVEKQRLIFAGKQLEDGKTVADYNIEGRCTLHVLLRLTGGIGERAAILETITAGMQQGNMRGPITETNGRSAAIVNEITRNKAKMSELLNGIETAISAEDTVEIANVFKTEVDNTDPDLLNFHLKAAIYETLKAGNCGEFSDLTASKIIQNTTNQWVYTASMAGTYVRDGITHSFNHALVVTYPDFVDDISNMDERAIVADSWGENVVCSLADFLDGVNPYGEKCQLEIKKAFPANGIKMPLEIFSKIKDLIQPILEDPDLEDSAKGYLNLLKDENVENLFEGENDGKLDDSRTIQELEAHLWLAKNNNEQHIQEIQSLDEEDIGGLFHEGTAEIKDILFEAFEHCPNQFRDFLLYLDTFILEYIEKHPSRIEETIKVWKEIEGGADFLATLEELKQDYYKKSNKKRSHEGDDANSEEPNKKRN